MKKIIFLFTMLLAVGMVNAKTSKLYATFTSVGNNNISWDASAKKFTISGDSEYKGGNNTYQMFSFDAGTLSNYKKIHLNITNKDNTRVLFMAGSTTVKTWVFGSDGEKNVDITSIDGLDADNIATITSIRIGGPGSGSSVITTPIYIEIDPAEVYLETAEYEGMEITTTINSSSDKDKPFAWTATGTLSTISNNLGKTESGTIFGYSTDNSTTNGYFDVTGYDKVKLTLAEYDGDKNNQVRLLSGDGNHLVLNCQDGTTEYEASLTVAECTSIKAGAGESTCQKVSTIAFIKDFNAASTTAFNIAASTGSAVAYDRTFTVGRKSTVCLPFALTEAEVTAAGKFYELQSVSDGTLVFNKVTETVAYKPYVFVPASATPFANLTNKAIVATPAAASGYATTVGGYTFQGTLGRVKLPSGVYGYNASTGAFSKTTSAAVTIDAFRAYFIAPPSARQLNCIFSDETTDIKTVNSIEKDNDTVFNLSGQRVSEDHRGIVIKNGRKLLVK